MVDRRDPASVISSQIKRKRGNMAWSVEQVIQFAQENHASDVHLIRGIAPAFRIDGEIRLAKGEPLSAENLQAMVNQILINPRQHEALADKSQLCVSRLWPGMARFRVSIYMRGGHPEMAIRVAEGKIRSRQELGLPEVIDALTRLPSGLVLVTGATGTGKTTTLNYMIDLINRERRVKIVTVEDPVEYTHDNHMSIIVQQEVHTDTPSFRDALTHVLRQDPDVIVVGEMRDLETISTAMSAAETGHLVLATLHTPDAVQTVQRIFSVFPSEQQNNVMYQLSNSLQAVLAQALLPRTAGGLILACEVCVSNAAIRKHIRDGQPHHIMSEIQSGKKLGMRSMDECLLTMYQKGEITFDTALSHARDPASMRQRTTKEPGNGG
jgi:twitching motility protein PilT